MNQTIVNKFNFIEKQNKQFQCSAKFSVAITLIIQFVILFANNLYASTLNFDNNGATSSGTTSYSATYPSSIAQITPPTKTGYTFDGYYTGTSGTGTQYYSSNGSSLKSWDIAGNTTLYANWIPNTYVVKLDNQSATNIETTSVTATYGQAMPAASMPQKTGCVFNGYWSEIGGAGIQYYSVDGSSAHLYDVPNTTTLYASQISNSYTITFDSNGGNSTIPNESIKYGAESDSNTASALSGVIKDRCSCAGQFDSQNGGTEVYNSNGSVVAGTKYWDLNSKQCYTENITLYAHQTYNEYLVSFETNGGTSVDSITISAANGPALIPYQNAPSKADGELFIGQYSDSALTKAQNFSTDKASSDITLYAKWTNSEIYDTPDQDVDKIGLWSDDKVSFAVSFEAGNTENYTYQWYKYSDQGDYDSVDDVKKLPLSSMTKVVNTDLISGNASGAFNADAHETGSDMAIEFYVKPQDSMDRYMLVVSNEAGNQKFVYPRLLVQERFDYDSSTKTLTIKHTGYVSATNDERKQAYAFPMNNYDMGGAAGDVPYDTPQNNYDIENVDIDGFITNIDSLNNLTNLKHVSFTNDTATAVQISNGAFSNDTSLAGTVLPESVTQINSNAFYNCTGLTDVYIKGSKVDIASDAFSIADGTTRDVDDADLYNSISSKYDKYTDKENLAALNISGSDDPPSIQKSGVLENFYGKLTLYGNKYVADQIMNFMTSDDSFGDHRIYYIPNNSDQSNSSSQSVDWQYTTNSDGDIDNIWTSTQINGTLYIPKSYDGKKVVSLSAGTDYSNSMVRNASSTVTAVTIPEYIEKLDAETINTLSATATIYNFSSSTEINSADGDGNGTMVSSVKNAYMFFDNTNFESSVSGDATRYFLDVDDSELTGKYSSGVTWTIDLQNHTITIGSDTDPVGGTDSYTDSASEPYYRFRNYVTTIIVNDDVTSIENNAYADFNYVNRIYNYSSKIQSISSSAFLNVGYKVTKLKKAHTAISNIFAKQLSALGFETTFTTTKGINAGTGALADYIVNNDGSVVLDLYNGDGGSDFTSENDVTWNCARDTITRINIESDVKHISAYSFYGTTALSTVQNYSRSYDKNDAQTIGGTGTEAILQKSPDTIARPASEESMSSVAKITVPSAIPVLHTVADYTDSELMDILNSLLEQEAKTSGTTAKTITSQAALSDSRKTSYTTKYLEPYFESEYEYNSSLTQDQLYENQLLTVINNLSINGMKIPKSTFEEYLANNSDKLSALTGPYKLTAGDYYISKPAGAVISADETNHVLNVLYGIDDQDGSSNRTVNVYAFTSWNTAFVDAVPQGPEEKPTLYGYKLSNISIADGQCGDTLYWYVTEENGLVITGTGDMWNYGSTESTGKSVNAPWYKYKDKITSVTIDSGATSVGDFAFAGLTGIESTDDYSTTTKDSSGNNVATTVAKDVSIPSTIKSVGEMAFNGCSDLIQFSFGDNVESIGGGVLSQCNNLKVEKITLPSGGKYKFDENKFYIYDTSTNSLIQYLGAPDGVDIAVTYTVDLPITQIADYAFYGEYRLITLYANENVTNIGESSFGNMPNLKEVGVQIDAQQTASIDALLDSGNSVVGDTKTAIMYKSNTAFADAAKSAGYAIKYYDDITYDHITLNYIGDDIFVGNKLDTSKVVATIWATKATVKESNVIVGSDTRFTLYQVIKDEKKYNDLIVHNITNETDGTKNVFYARFNPGYGMVDENESYNFEVKGINGISKIEFSYTGSDVYIGKETPLENIYAIITYNDGSRKTVNGKTSKFISVDKNTITAVGDNKIVVKYDDGVNSIFQGTITIKGKNYVTGMTAVYNGDPIEFSAGIDGLNKDQVAITVNWADGSTLETTGKDSRIDITTDGQIYDNDKMAFVAKYLNDNPNDVYQIFTVNFTNSIQQILFTYIGSPVTRGTTINKNDIQATIIYSNGAQTKKVRCDTLSGFSIDPQIMQESDKVVTVHCTYVEAGVTYEGDIAVPGTVEVPVKLIIVKRPNKTVYQTGDHFDITGMEVDCLFTNGDVVDVTNARGEINETGNSIRGKLTMTTKDGKDILDGNATLSTDDTIITITYQDELANAYVSTNMSLNMNLYQKEIKKTGDFKEQYEITRILFCSKKTTDEAEAKGLTKTKDDWIDITPTGESSYFGTNNEVQATIKAGYGFKLKVYTNYHTNRGGTEFLNFINKDKWDESFSAATPEGYGTEAELNAKGDSWANYRYLNDVYPQSTPTLNPDVLYLRVVGTTIDNPVDTEIKANDNANTLTQDGKTFVTLERTDTTVDGDTVDFDAGPWYNSTKIFEFQERVLKGSNNQTMDRVLYTSSDAANPEIGSTDYTIQIISPAQYGYEPEPQQDKDAGKFVSYNEAKFGELTTGTAGNLWSKNWNIKNWNTTGGTGLKGTKYLHVCAAVNLRVTANDDIHTHILQ